MSNPVIEIELDARGKQLAENLRALSQPQTFLGAIAEGLNNALPIVTAHVSEQRLTGEGPFPVAEHRLGVVSNKLRGSTRWTKAGIEGGTVTGSIGTNAEYAGAHEFGFKGEVSVAQHSRHVRSRDIEARVERRSARTGRLYKATDRIASGVAIVKAHRRKMNVPARAPFGFGIADSTQTIVDKVTEAIGARLNATGGGAS